MPLSDRRLSHGRCQASREKTIDIFFFVVEVVDHGVGRDLTFSHVIGRGHAQTSIGAVQNPIFRSKIFPW